ncbi:hypothetical protein RJ639_004214 [Escallonia herrerae]|uniref:Vacuolar cation/proton exchanger n=1 Tax=Escallonia herrerae TaxID=1293975 RepID=A0AA88W9M2_9ASTE|nr:hypothetical protein RJ639_004214 [Escallonia herrerae]
MMGSSSEEHLNMENGGLKDSSKEHRNGRTAHNMSSSLLRKRSDPKLLSRVRFRMLKEFLTNLQEVLTGTKLCVLFPAIPLAIAANHFSFGRTGNYNFYCNGYKLIARHYLVDKLSNAVYYPFFFVISSYITKFKDKWHSTPVQQYNLHAVGGLINATCGNATELIIALLALHKKKIQVVKFSLLGSIHSNLLLVLGTSLFFGGLANMKDEQRYDRRQADVNSLLLLFGLLCHALPLMFRYAVGPVTSTARPILQLSRASSTLMLLLYFAYILFQLKTHRQLFEADEEVEGEGDDDEKPVIGFWSAFIWLVLMTIVISILSEYVVGTIEAASESWDISMSFISIILLPIVGNAAEHAGSVIFALKNKLDISLGVALGSASQISAFVVPLCVIVAWIMGIDMDLDFSLLETGSVAFSIIITAFTLQVLSCSLIWKLRLCLIIQENS